MCPSPALLHAEVVAMKNLIPCPDCDKPVSRRAPTCPHCGCPLRGVSRPPRRLGFFRALFGALAVGLVAVVLPIAWLTVPRAGALPSYRVASTTQLLGGGTAGEVIVPSFDGRTPEVRLAATAAAIADREGLKEVHLFASDDARRAAFSESFAKNHPGSLQGSLGFLENGRFTAAASLD